MEIADRLINVSSPQPTFLVELSRVLANPGNSQVARVAAGLQIKNSLTSKDPDIKAQYQQRWLAIDANARREVKNYVSDCQILDIIWFKGRRWSFACDSLLRPKRYLGVRMYFH